MSDSKRKGVPDDVDVANKRTRFSTNGDAAQNGTSVPVPSKPKISLDVLEKAKKALQLQKQLQEKLKALPGAKPAGAGLPVAVPAAAGSSTSVLAAGLQAAAALSGNLNKSALPLPSAAPVLVVPPKDKSKPVPLRLDEQGREIDEEGNVIERPIEAVTTLKINQKAEEAKARAAAAAVAASSAVPEPPPEPQLPVFFDPELGNRGLKRLERRKRATFNFVKEGLFQKQAEQLRLRAKFGDEAVRQMQQRQREEKRLAADNIDVNKIPLGQKPPVAAEEPEVAPIPEVEWWDARLLPSGSYEDVMTEEPLLREDRITHLVEHPVLIAPPAEPPPPPPQPLRLTKKEQKKLRTQRRVAREKEKQELIRQGLLEPPKPKVKISNLMRVLGTEATADPTAIEAEVRKQMAERQQAHDDRNEARKLTPAEARDKKLRKLFDDGHPETHVSVYRVGSLRKPQNKFKVKVNAEENHMTGIALITEDFCVVVVEGCPKSQRRYQKLMLNRIKWQAGNEDEDEEQAGGEAESDANNYCYLVWQGVVLQPAFDKFLLDIRPTKEAAKELLNERGVPHYWDLAAAYVPP